MTTLSRDEARAYLVSQLGLARPRRERGARGVRAMLDALRQVQLDPLDPMGTNVWEVYKPASERRFGWYVVPLLHRGRLVGRLEGRVEKTTLVIERVWRESGVAIDEDALDTALERHAIACGCDRVVRRPGARRRRTR